ncbi:unnamed protein product [Zymoseptoria tritici ST99CH_3D7]|uniref:Tachykinin family protein n=3 Tax=Zymoseptoria tritici TaxID=1047171 RepID=A0A1X7RWL8_ZYMT9|nr:unnamed protein product [Zymoseptoria tritici ST99CH_3D7]
MKMHDDLPIINFSTKKYVSAADLSRIRSHAQQRVQDQRLARRSKSEADPELRAAKNSRDALLRGEQAGQQSFTFALEPKPRDEVTTPSTSTAPSTKRRKRTVKKQSATPGSEGHPIVKRESHSLSASPGERPDPFDSFPITIDAQFMELAEGYLLGWKWPHAKELLFRETMSQPILVHSFLAIANHIWRRDEWKSMWHENVAISHMRNGLAIVNTLNPQDRTPLARALTWAIIRLATIKINQGQLETSISHLNALALIAPDMTEWEGTPFGGHFQTATASLLLANYTQSTRVRKSLHLPFGPMTTTAVSDVTSTDFFIPSNAIMLAPILSTLLSASLIDALTALTALYNTTAAVSSLPHTHTGVQAREAVKISLRLARLGPVEHEPFPSPGRSWQLEFAECVRLTALLFTWEFGRNSSSQNDTVASARRHNRAFLTARVLGRVFDEVEWKESEDRRAVSDLVLWMLVVCGSTTPIPEDRIYYANLARIYFPDSWKWGYEDVQRLGRVLPWIEPPEDPPAEAWWEIVRNPDWEAGKKAWKQETGAPLLLGYIPITPGLKARRMQSEEARDRKSEQEGDDDG